MSTELVELRTFYGAPHRLYLAFNPDGDAVGVVGVRLLTPAAGEVRRLYVDSASRTGGLGRRLVEQLIADAVEAGLARLVLTTLPTMVHARALYLSLGFKETAPYVEEPTEGVEYYELDLLTPRS
jgi:putative acetyltransferase